MAQLPAATTAHRLTPVQWVICAMAAIGFAFDTYALLVLPLIVRPALMEIAKVKPGTPDFNYWVGLLFYIPAVAGGIFGLLGGYLTDRLGRRRVLVWSILLYAFSALASGLVNSVGALLVLRCTTFIGVSVEFVAAVAWLAELFPDAKQREAVLGYTQAFSSVGGLLISAAYYLAVTYSKSLPAIHGWHAEAAQHRRVVPAGVSQDHPAHRLDVRVQLRRGFRRDSAHSAHRTGLTAGRTPRTRRAGADREQGAISAGDGRSAGPGNTGVPGDPQPQPPATAAHLSVSGTVSGALRVLLSGHPRSGHDGGGHLPCRAAHRGAVQLLGELSPPDVPHAPARHRRELRGQYRRPHGRHLGRTADHATRQRDAGRHAVHQAGLFRQRRRAASVRCGVHLELLVARATAG